MKNISVSVFFPCYNDAGTIISMTAAATSTLKKMCRQFEVIVVDDGSTDSSRELLKKEVKKNRYLRVVFHQKNKGYGGALISGFGAATYEWVFYTDGDAQYDVMEIKYLVSKISPKVDVIQGYKVKRHDPWYRIVIGELYNFAVKLAFAIKIRDVDCDFRLIRRNIFEKVKLKHLSGVITVEMVKKLEDAGFSFAQVPVNHYDRSWGTSQFFNFRRIARVAFEIIELWSELVLSKWIAAIISKKRKF